MDRDNLSHGEMLASVSAILLSYLMFFNWFEEQPTSETDPVFFSYPRYNAWDALDYIPIILAITIAAALVLPMLRLMLPDFRPRFSVNATVGALGIVSALLILYRIVDPPGFRSEETLFGTVNYVGVVQLPIFLALVAALGIALGGFWAMRHGGAKRTCPDAGGLGLEGCRPLG